MRVLKAGVIYFLLVFAVGWVLGPIRELWAVPHFGRIAAMLSEAVIMLIAMIVAAPTQAGLPAARRAGRTGGRPPKLTEDDLEAARAMLANPDIGVTQIAHRLGVSLATLYRYIPAARTANTPLG